MGRGRTTQSVAHDIHSEWPAAPEKRGCRGMCPAVYPACPACFASSRETKQDVAVSAHGETSKRSRHAVLGPCTCPACSKLPKSSPCRACRLLSFGWQGSNHAMAQSASSPGCSPLDFPTSPHHPFLFQSRYPSCKIRVLEFKRCSLPGILSPSSQSLSPSSNKSPAVLKQRQVRNPVKKRPG